jgi:hypothetical protein
VIPDPRTGNRKVHKLIDIITIAIIATLCGEDDWVSIEEFGLAREEWFRKFLELPHGIPSHDTFGRVFSLLSAEAFEQALLNFAILPTRMPKPWKRGTGEWKSVDIG